MKSRLIYFKNRIRRYRHAPLLAFAGRIALFILGGISIGTVSAWYMIEKGSALTTTESGSWQLWFHDGDVGADPYTLAHMSRNGRLPITSSNALYFRATNDSEGEKIAADCDYSLTGKPLDTDWWSLAVYTPDGRSIKNKSAKSSLNSSSVLRYENGNFTLNLSRQVVAGNWIEISGNKELTLLIRLYGIHANKDSQRGNSIEQNLPIIRRLDCH